MKKLSILALAALLAMTSAASAVITLTNPDGSFYAGHQNGIDARVLQQNVITYNGQTANEYVIDIFASYYKGRDYLEVYYARLVGLDPTQILNYDTDGQFKDVWGNMDADMASWGWWGPEARGPFLAFPDKANDQWLVHPTAQQISDNGWVYNVNFALTHGMVNPFHAVSDYSATDVTAVWSRGSPSDEGTMANGVFTAGQDGVQDSLFLGFPQNAASYVSAPTPQLTSTMRIVTTEDLSSAIANGGMGFVYDDGWGGGRVSVLEMYTPIPEPATMSLLAIGGIAALIRRKK